MTKKEKQLIIREAARHVAAVETRGHLDAVGNDADDFLTVPVWSLKAALFSAYEAGKAARKN